MGYNEALNEIKKVKESSIAYQEEVNAFQSKLIEFASNMEGLYNSVDNIESETLIYYTKGNISNLYNKITEAANKSSSALSTLTDDANKEIKRIVDEYNSSIKYDEDGKPTSPRLSYETISLSSISGIGAFTGSSGGNNSGGSNNSSNPRSNNQNENDETNKLLKKRLEDNNLTDKVASLTYNNSTFYCELTNGKKYNFPSSDIESREELLEKVKSFL